MQLPGYNISHPIDLKVFQHDMQLRGEVTPRVVSSMDVPFFTSAAGFVQIRGRISVIWIDISFVLKNDLGSVHVVVYMENS
jgi:hypothetical protein